MKRLRSKFIGEGRTGKTESTKSGGGRNRGSITMIGNTKDMLDISEHLLRKYFRDEFVVLHTIKDDILGFSISWFTPGI